MSELLRKPQHNEDWVCCLVPADQVESNTSKWGYIKHLPSVHVVGKTFEDAFYMVAVHEFCLQWLLDHDVPFELESERGFYYKVWEPTDGEIRVYGIAEARNRAQLRFLRNAIQGIRSEYGRGLDRFYRRHTSNQSMLAPIEFAIVIRDIKVSFFIETLGFLINGV